MMIQGKTCITKGNTIRKHFHCYLLYLCDFEQYLCYPSLCCCDISVSQRGVSKDPILSCILWFSAILSIALVSYLLCFIIILVCGLWYAVICSWTISQHACGKIKICSWFLFTVTISEHRKGNSLSTIE